MIKAKLFGMRPWATPLWKPIHPFVFGAVGMTYLMWVVSDSLSKSEMFRNHPSNPALRYKKVEHH
ncbi:hypothetical protein IWQ61_003658 [Dispira simplex]|nr:hypothetical protein IWQ61_003658 [Dispira simplex]